MHLTVCRKNAADYDTAHMKLFLITLGVFGIFILAMAVGVIFGNRRLRGSCGGVGGEGCDICGAGPENDEVNDARCGESEEAVAVAREA